MSTETTRQKLQAEHDENRYCNQLPLARKVMDAACLMVVGSLQQVIKAATDPVAWRDEYHDAISAVEVALSIVQNLKAGVSLALDDYAKAWWQAASVARLAMEALSDKETVMWRHLSNAVSEFVVLQNFVDFVSVQDVQKGGAA